MRRAAVLAALALGPCTAALGGPRAPEVATYRIEASYRPDHHLTGRETVRFTNRTSRAFEDLQLHLYLNAWRNDRSTWIREEEAGGGRDRGHRRTEEWFGYSDINRIALADGTDLTGGVRFIAPDDGNADDRTAVSVPLPRPVGPGETLVFTIDWESRFPRTIARTGWKDDFVMGAQWFPKLSAASDRGWVTHQFHAPTEFFADFGDYDVTLTLPKELKGRVGATGVLKEETELPGDLVRVRFGAEDVIDFAWTASPRYEVYRDTFTHPGLPNVDLILLLQPDHRAVKDRYFRATKEGLARYGAWYLPYPYPVLTIVDPAYGAAASGMEYPNIFTGGAHWLAPAGVHSPEGVTVHEFGHQIFYAILASNEFEEAHLDEGFTTYATHKVLKEAYGDPSLERRVFGVPFTWRSVKLPYPLAPSERYLGWQVSSRSDASSVPTFRDLDGKAALMNAYSKTALLLASCERTLGEATWARVMKTYCTKWAFRHPTSHDFRDVLTEIAGPSAGALLDQTWGSSDTIDYAVTAAESHRIPAPAGYLGDGTARRFAGASPPKAGESAPWESSAVIRRMGEAYWPVDVVLRFEGGWVVKRTWDGKSRWIRYRATGPRLLEAVVDPEGKCLLDVNVLNNGKRTKKDEAGADRWAHRLRFWAQNALELFASLGAAVPGGGR